MGVWDVDPGAEMEEVGVSEVIFSCGDDMRAIQNQLMEYVELWRVQSREGRMRSGKLSRLSMWGNEPSCHTPGYILVRRGMITREVLGSSKVVLDFSGNGLAKYKCSI